MSKKTKVTTFIFAGLALVFALVIAGLAFNHYVIEPVEINE